MYKMFAKVIKSFSSDPKLSRNLFTLYDDKNYSTKCNQQEKFYSVEEQ
jgi:hypothetical protein